MCPRKRAPSKSVSEWSEDALEWTDAQLDQLLADHDRDIAFRLGGGYPPTERSRADYYEKIKGYDPNDPTKDYSIKALNLIRARKYNEARKYLAAIRTEDKNRKLAPLRRGARVEGGRTNTKDGTRDKQRPKKYLEDVGDAVLVDLRKKMRGQVSEDIFRDQLRAELDAVRADPIRGAKWPWRDTEDGSSKPCPRSSFNDYIRAKFPR
jgi:hypothetical protein